MLWIKGPNGVGDVVGDGAGDLVRGDVDSASDVLRVGGSGTGGR
jgi:hypothetical protein